MPRLYLLWHHIKHQEKAILHNEKQGSIFFAKNNKSKAIVKSKTIVEENIHDHKPLRNK